VIAEASAMNKTRRLAAAAAAACALLGAMSRSTGATDSGTVYYTLQVPERWTLSSMASDGSGKTALLESSDVWGSGPYGSVSRTVHAGQRWVIETRRISGETYAGTTVPRRELFAVSLDGAVEAPLTLQADLMPVSARWSPGDQSISWIAVRWSGGVSGPQQIYVAAIDYDGAGVVLGLAEQPTAPTLALPGGGSVASHDWAPDAARMVLSDTSRALWTATLSTGALTRLQTIVKKRPQDVFGLTPVWSPDGSRIAYSEAGDIRTIAPNGASPATIAPRGTNTSIVHALPAWSPSSTDVVFVRITGFGGRHDVYRVAASGGPTANLTAEIDTRPTTSGGGGTASPRDWR
jgi:hypothetical protein